MRLKKLELQGYKTFASRTEFVFESGITAVIGPNGCGKSNVADAIRWVLGEQSYSLLRGKKTEDMIFSGSQRRARAGMAQATLVLDNEDGLFPVDFSELAIGRRAYRSGENEYLLNGSRVRLRDTEELLSVGSLGQRTYSVIGQGLVDAALSLRADERRALFEEAAGISLYKERREDALKKLDETQRNLERVDDILTEISPRMRRLERQAERSREFNQVQADLENLLYLWYGHHWEMAKHRLRAARREAESCSAELTSISEEQVELDGRLSQMRHEAGRLRAHLGDLHRENSQLHQQAEAVQRNLAVQTERLRMLRLQQEEIEAELTPLQEQRERAAGLLAQAETTLAQASGQREEQQAAVQAAQHALEQRRREIAQLREQEQRLQREWVRLESQASSLADRRAELGREAVRLAAEQEAEQETMAQAAADRKTAAETLSGHQARLAEFERQIGSLQQRREELRPQRQTAQSELERLRGIRQEAQARLAGLEAQLGALEALRARGAGHTAAVQDLLAAPDRPAGILAPVAQLLPAPAELEAAIAAALGDQLSALVVADWDSAERVLAHPAANERELALLPLSSLRPPRPISAPDDPDVIGVATALVQCEPAYRPAANLLLGQAVLVRHLQAARRIAPSLPAGGRAVTLEGLVVWQDGRVTRPGHSDGSGLLAQERAWRALPEQMAQAGAALEAAGAELAAELAQVEALDAQLDGLEQELRAAQEARQSADREREAASLQLDRLKQNIAWHQQRLAEMAQRAAAQQDELASLEGSAGDLEQAQAELRTQHQQLRMQLAELPVNELADQLAALERALAQTEGARQNQQALVATHRNTFQQFVQQLENRNRRSAELAGERQLLAKEVESQREQETRLAKELAAANELIAPAEARLKVVEAELDRLLHSEEKLKRQVRNAEHAASRAQLALDRQEAELEHLRSRIQDDLGLVHLPLDEDIAGQTPLPLGEMVGQLPLVKELPPGLQESIQRRKQQLRRMGPVNPNAPSEYLELAQRHTFLTEQMADLKQADGKLREVIAELDVVMEREFQVTFRAVAAEFKEAFTRLFGGGSARLILTDPDNPIQSGVEIIARPPGRRQQGLALLSGGERSLTAAALVFSLLKVSPTPFCVLDEVDAMLDEANVGRFREMLLELSERTQFIIITHNRGTIQAADTIYGISMGEDGVSQAISLRLDGEEVVAGR